MLLCERWDMRYLFRCGHCAWCLLMFLGVFGVRYTLVHVHLSLVYALLCTALHT